jgi:hypothetical protein
MGYTVTLPQSWLTWRLWSWRRAFVVGERSEMLRSTGRSKKFREEYFRRRARELADTGRFERWQGIEFELRFVEGVREAGVWLGSEPLREELDMLCQRDKSRPKTPT